jgi:hypothetical protein
MSRVVSSSFAVALLITAPAFAQDPPTIEPGIEPPPVTQQIVAPPAAFDRPGFDFAARLGYAFPFGNAAGDSKLSDGVTGAVPLVVEAGYRFDAHFTIGALFQYGFALLEHDDARDCRATDCTGRVVRLGIQGIFNLDRETSLIRWLGIGTGYEWLNADGGPDVRGFELVTLQAGAEYRVSPQVALGPFFSLSLARYSTAYTESTSMELADKRMHEWLQIGMRGRIGL